MSRFKREDIYAFFVLVANELLNYEQQEEKDSPKGDFSSCTLHDVAITTVYTLRRRIYSRHKRYSRCLLGAIVGIHHNKFESLRRSDIAQMFNICRLNKW